MMQLVIISNRIKIVKKPTQKEKGLTNQNWKNGGKGDHTCRVRELCSSAHME